MFCIFTFTIFLASSTDPKTLRNKSCTTVCQKIARSKLLQNFPSFLQSLLPTPDSLLSQPFSSCFDLRSSLCMSSQAVSLLSKHFLAKNKHLPDKKASTTRPIPLLGSRSLQSTSTSQQLLLRRSEDAGRRFSS